MKAAAFDYARAKDMAHALDLLARHGEGARIIAGGQSLVPALNMRLVRPDILVDIGGLDGLRAIEARAGHIEIGALVRHVDLLHSSLIAAKCPLIAEAVRHVAHPAIRNRGTIGGNLANADPASELPACMLALDATIVVTGAAGDRRIAAKDFFQGVYVTALREGEILARIEIPDGGVQRRSAFMELARRHGDYALAGVACVGERGEGDRTVDLRIACFAVSDRPVLATAVAERLIGQNPTAALIEDASRHVADDIDAIGDAETSADMRLHLMTILVEGALLQVLDVPERVDS